jgi:uncharacterized membrane protein
MPSYETLLFLHVTSAFAFVASYAGFTVAFLFARRVDRPEPALALLRIVRPADALAWIGATGTILFGVWLAIKVDGYELWDSWIVGALALWLVTEEALRRENLLFGKARRAARAPLATPEERAADVRALLRTRTANLLHGAGGVGMLGILALMIFKPGAGG